MHFKLADLTSFHFRGMASLLRALICITSVCALASCGGGEQAEPDVLGKQALAMPSVLMPTPSQLFDWAQVQFPTHFPSFDHIVEHNFVADPYIYRHYPLSGNYLGVAGDDVYILGPVMGGGPVPARVGRLVDFGCEVLPASCQSGGGDFGDNYLGTWVGGCANNRTRTVLSFERQAEQVLAMTTTVHVHFRSDCSDPAKIFEENAKITFTGMRTTQGKMVDMFVYEGLTYAGSYKNIAFVQGATLLLGLRSSTSTDGSGYPMKLNPTPYFKQ